MRKLSNAFLCSLVISAMAIMPGFALSPRGGHEEVDDVPSTVRFFGGDEDGGNGAKDHNTSKNGGDTTDLKDQGTSGSSKSNLGDQDKTEKMLEKNREEGMKEIKKHALPQVEKTAARFQFYYGRPYYYRPYYHYYPYRPYYHRHYYHPYRPYYYRW
ncbi:MAG: hypothetical protein K940chlam9_00330 [Chlamydiae bacterium]|nr:hypothetical protein [Chlamydiota bacterium]